MAEVLNLGEARTWSMGLWARHVLEAAGSVALERCGAILDERTAAALAAGEIVRKAAELGLVE